MNSQTHVLLGAVLFGKPMPRLAWMGAAGGLTPDLPMYVIIAGLRMQGYSLDRIFGELYWQEWWQVANAIGHNILIWGALALLTLLVLLLHRKAGWHGLRTRFAKGDAWAMGFAFSGSALLSSATDLILHHDDGHMHFWPLTDWRFSSPVSYWDPDHHGAWFSLFEASLGVLLAAVLFRRYANPGIRLVLVMIVLAYVAVPLFYFWSLSGT